MRFIWIIMLCAVLLPVVPAWAEKPSVLVVNSYDADNSWLISHNEALSEGLDGKVDLTVRYLDSKRLPPREYERLARVVWEEFRRLRPSVVVLTDDNAVALLGRRIMDAGTPVVFLGVNQNPRKYLGDLRMATGVLERPLYKRSLLYLESLLDRPLDRCLILFDSGTTSQVILEETFGNRTSQVMGDTVTDVRLVETFAEWQALVRSAPKKGYDLLFAGLYHTLVDEDGNHVPCREVINWTSAHSEIPVFGFWHFAVGKGRAVGGLVHSGEIQGRLAAELVLRILDGEDPSHIHPEIAKYGDFEFSRHELKRWGITIPAHFSAQDHVSFVE